VRNENVKLDLLFFFGMSEGSCTWGWVISVSKQMWAGTWHKPIEKVISMRSRGNPGCIATTEYSNHYPTELPVTPIVAAD